MEQYTTNLFNSNSIPFCNMKVKFIVNENAGSLHNVGFETVTS